MGYVSTMQMIQRNNNTRQYHLICPAPLAEVLEIQKSEPIEWVVEDKRAPKPKKQKAA